MEDPAGGKIPDQMPRSELRGGTPRRSNRRGSVAMLIAFRMARGIAAGMMSVALPYLVLNTLHESSLALGAIYVVGVVSTAVLGVLAGHLSDKWNHKGALLITGAMVPVSALMVYVNQSFPMLLAASIVGGFAAMGSLVGGGVGGAAQPVQSSVIARLSTSENRTTYYSVLAFLGGIAGAAGALLVHYFSTRNTFLAAAIISAVGTGLLCFITIPEYVVTGVQRAQSKRAIRHFSITGALNGFSQGLLTPFLIPFFVLVYHLSKSRMAIYTAIGSILGAVALLTAPALERRLGFVRSITFTRALGTALLLVMAMWHNLWLGVAIYLITPALRIAALPAQQSAIINRVEGQSMGRALAINQVTRLSGASAAMICTGVLFDISELEMPFFLFAGVMTVNIYLYYHFFGHDGQNGAAEPSAATEATAPEPPPDS